MRRSAAAALGEAFKTRNNHIVNGPFVLAAASACDCESQRSVGVDIRWEKNHVSD